MSKTIRITTPTFHCEINSSMQWMKLIRPTTDAFRIRYEINDVSYEINIIIMDGKKTSVRELTENKFLLNQHSAFAEENIPPFELLNQQAGLNAWSCRYRWVDGASAPYRKQDVFMEIKDKVVHFLFMAAPGDFDQGFIEFLKIVQSVQPN